MSKDRYALTFDEMARARHFFQKHAEEYITQEFQMRTILSEMGQYPPSSELNYCLEQFEGKMNFNNFCNYCCYLKKKYSRPEPKDVDTLRAFVALGGAGDRSGDVSADLLRTQIANFRLTVDIDKMIQEVDEDGSGCIEYGEFAAMWAAQDENQVEEEEPPAEEEASPGGSLSRKNSMKEEEVTLDEEDNLQVVRGFLFPLQRQQTMAATMDAVAKRKQSRKSFVKLPPLGMSVRSRAAAVDIGETVVEEEELPPAAGLKPAPPPQAQTARQSNAGFIPPSPTILDFRGGKSTLKKKSSSKSPRKSSSPRKPNSARGSKRSRLY